MNSFGVDPVALAKRQFELDRARTLRFPDLLRRKVDRMKASPLAFLRGAGPLFYELLKARPPLASGPAGEGWLSGDSHLENFGAFKCNSLTEGNGAASGPPPKVDAKKEKREAGKKEKAPGVTFHLNDFDEAFVGPWRIDVARLLTSLILAGRELGSDGTRTIALCDELLEAYVSGAFYAAHPAKAPKPVQILLDRAVGRSRSSLLEARTELVKGKRRFVRGERYRELPSDIARLVPKTFDQYMKSLPKEERLSTEQAEILDFALRIAGTGSLGCTRIAVLVAGKGGEDGAWIFDMKEQAAPSASSLFAPPKLGAADRVVEAMRACLPKVPRMLGTARLGTMAMFARRLAPQEDKLDLRKLGDSDLDSLASYLGALLGQAHARGAKKLPKDAWTRSHRDEMLDRAIAIAGVHEAVYLAYCRLARDVP